MPIIPINNYCNNRCLICSNPLNFPDTKQDFSYDSIKKRLLRFFWGGNEFIDNFRDQFVITGGEPTLSPCFEDILRAIVQYFPQPQITLLSNGRMFSYKKYADKICSLVGNLHIAISILGPNAKTHDSITRAPGSFAQTVKGLKNICRVKTKQQFLEVRVIINGLNYKVLPETLRFINKNITGINRLVFIFQEVEGWAEANFKLTGLTYAQVNPYIKELFRHIPSKTGLDIRLYHFPLCVLPSNLYQFVWRTLPKNEVAFLKECSYCMLKSKCLGVHKGYLKKVGRKEFCRQIFRHKIIEGENTFHPIKAIIEK